MEDDQFSNLDRLFETDNYLIDLASILYIGRRNIFESIRSWLASEYQLIYSQDFNSAIPQLLREKFSIVLIDAEANNFDINEVGERVRTSQPIARIMAVVSNLELTSLYSIVNSDAINGMIPYPCTVEQLIKIINQQDANYTINNAMISIVTQPPNLSKASLLLLDPTLTFADETQPIDFVGVFIVYNSVPKFTRFFEKTLAHDELLMAGYLSSISSLGDELFKNKETLKEINFGGISVIQRFIDKLQISFLVRHLTRHNQERAEQRIEKAVQLILEYHLEHLQAIGLAHEHEKDLAEIVDELDIEDQIENEKYLKRKALREKRNSAEQIIIVYSKDNEVARYVEGHIQNQLGPEFIYSIRCLEDEQEVIQLLVEENSAAIIIDRSVKEEENLSEFMDYVKETSPSIQVILLTTAHKLSLHELHSFNVDDLDFVAPFPNTQESIEILQDVCRKSLDNAWNIKKHLSFESATALLDPATVRTILRESGDSFTEEDQPILHGIIILKDQEELFQQFWELDDGSFSVDRNLLTGLIASLQNVGSEAFMKKKSILGMEIGGSELIVNHRTNFMFLYFIKNVRPNTAVLIEKELEAVSSLYYEIIVEAAGMIPLHQLKSLFLQIAYKANEGFTELLREHIS